MTIDPKSLSLVYYPDDILITKAKPVDVADKHVLATAKRMIEVMFEHAGVGLAAPQVGLSWRLFVTRDPEDENEGIVWLNPTIEIINDEMELVEEGCLSLPEIRGDIKRPIGIRITGHDLNGNETTMESEDFITRIWQHEYDHLDGILIIDKMSAMGRLMNRKKIKNLGRE